MVHFLVGIWYTFRLAFTTIVILRYETIDIQACGLFVEKGANKEFPLGTFKPQDNTEYETTLTVNYAKLIVANEEIFEIDVLGNIYKVDGVDIMAAFRANIGG